jgi:hypothetical protein
MTGGKTGKPAFLAQGLPVVSISGKSMLEVAHDCIEKFCLARAKNQFSNFSQR